MRPFSGLFQMQFTFLQTLHFVTPLKSDSNIGTLVRGYNKNDLGKMRHGKKIFLLDYTLVPSLCFVYVRVCISTLSCL